MTESSADRRAGRGHLTLTGIRVLDLGSRGSTAWCTRLLADYGADVIAVEPADGHPLRRDPPFAADGPSIPARYLLANKRLAGPAAVDRLLDTADVIVTDMDFETSGSAADLSGASPDAIVCALSPYGLNEARAKLPATELTVSALSGWASVNGHRDRTPLKSSGYQVAYQAGTFAFGCILTALIERLGSGGAGQLIDIAELEVLVSTFAPAPLRYQYSGFVWPRKQPLDVNDGPVPVADGYFALTISRPAFWIKAMRILGLPDLAEDQELQQAGLRPKLKERFADRVSEALSHWRRMELFDALAAERVIAGPVLRMDELADNPQLEARGFFREAPSGMRFPGPFARMGQTGWQLAREAESAAAAAPEFDVTDEVVVEPVRHGSDGKAPPFELEGPLVGFRGLVLTQAWAGTYATELLALLGAEVIQLEVRKRLDSWRGTYQNPIPRKLEDAPDAQHAWNLSPLYNSVNLNKQCITVDLDTTEGVALFKALVRHADFVAENFSPRVMAKLGLDYDTLTDIRPDLIMASLSAYGAIGPWANVPGIGGTIEPSSGMSALLGYEGEEPLNSGQMYPDPVAGLCGFAAISLALLHRDRTGEGQHIDLSMQEANFTFIGDAWLEYAMTGVVRGPEGNRHRRHAPHGIYPAAGDDNWLAIAVETDAQWQALVTAMDLPCPSTWDAAARKAAEAQIDAHLEALTARHDKFELSRKLTGVGVPAAAVQNAAEVAEDALLRLRGHMVAVTHPEAGEFYQSGLAAHFSRTPGGVAAHAPLQSEHSFAVFERLLGMTREDYEELVEKEVSGAGPVATSTVENQA